MNVDRFRAEFASAIDEAEGQLRFQPRDVDEAARGMRAASRDGLRVSLETGGAILLDLSKLSAVIELDESSRLIHVGAGALLSDIEALLRARSMSLALPYDGDLPLHRAFLTKLPGGASPDDDPVRQVVVGMEAILADGRAISIRPAPRRAVGPDLTLSTLKSGGELAFPLSFWLAFRAFAERVAIGFSFADKRTAEIALAQMRGRGVRPLFSKIDGEKLTLALEEGPLFKAMHAITQKVAQSLNGQELEARLDELSLAPEDAPASPSLKPLFDSIRAPR